MSAPVGPEPCRINCTTCKKEVFTRVEYKASSQTYLIALLLCCLGCFPCACCLFCTKFCRNAEHRCPSCNTFLGVYER